MATLLQLLWGGGLLHDAYQNIVITPLSYHRRAWPLMSVAETACQVRSVEPWWQGQLEVNILRDERLFLDDLAEVKQWEYNEESADNSSDTGNSYITWREPSDHMKLPYVSEDMEPKGVDELNKHQEVVNNTELLKAAAEGEHSASSVRSRQVTHGGKAGNTVKSKATISDTNSSSKGLLAKSGEPRSVDNASSPAKVPGILPRSNPLASWKVARADASEKDMSQPASDESMLPIFNIGDCNQTEMTTPSGPYRIKGKQELIRYSTGQQEPAQVEEPYEDFKDWSYLLGEVESDY